MKRIKTVISYQLSVISLLVLILTSASFAKQESILSTTLAGYSLLRAEANENTTLINLTTGGDFAHKPAAAKSLKADIGEHGTFITKAGIDTTTANGVQLIFCGGAAADKTFHYKIYAWKNANGPAEVVADGNGVLGTQAVVKYPDTAAAATSKFWADTLTVTGYWLKTVTSTATTGSNGVAKLWFDMCGYEWLYVEITSADNTTGTEAGLISVYWSYF